LLEAVDWASVANSYVDWYILSLKWDYGHRSDKFGVTYCMCTYDEWF